MTQPTVILCDTREPWPLHPWRPGLEAAGCTIQRGAVETGDFIMEGHPEVAVERKTAEDFIACMTANRDRFERELRRAAACLDRFAIIIEASMAGCLAHRRGLHVNAFLGTLATWARRYRFPFLFAESEAMAASLAYRFLTGTIREAKRVLPTRTKPMLARTQEPMP